MNKTKIAIKKLKYTIICYITIVYSVPIEYRVLPNF